MYLAKRHLWLATLLVAAAVSVLLAPIMAQLRPADEEICFARVRTIAYGMQMYLADYDETFPLAFGRDPVINWLWNFLHPVPHDWRPGTVSLYPAFASMWANAILPYLRSPVANTPTAYDWLRCPSVRPYRISGLDYTTARRRPAYATYTYNGLLHQYALALVENPATVPLVWEGRGRRAAFGYALSNPVLQCDIPNLAPLCRYNASCQPSGWPRGVMFALDGSIWIHPKGVLFAFVDGHVEWRRLGLVVGGATNPNYDPFTNYNAQGIPSASWRDSCGYPLLFRPRTQ